MRITDIYLDGFGVFHDVHVPELPPGLVLFDGSNESGKSTLLAFVRALLFGFPDGRSKENRYEPLAGGTHGGRLNLETRSGILTVERGPGPRGGRLTVYRADGTLAGPHELDQALGGTTRTIFRNIYAFSLDELQALETVQDDSVKDVLYAISTGTGVHALPAAEGFLDKAMDRLYAPRGRGGRLINDCMRRLRETIEPELRDARGTLEAYQQAAEDLRGTNESLADVGQRILRLRQQLATAEADVRLWEPWVAWRETSELLEHLPETGVSTDDLQALERRVETRDSLRVELEALASELDAQQREQSNCAVHPALLAERERIEQLARQSETQRANVKHAHEARARLQSSGDRLDAALKTLGPGWDRERVKETDYGLFTREKIHRFRDDTDAASRAREEARREARRITGEFEKATQAFEETAQALQAFDTQFEHARPLDQLRADRAVFRRLLRELLPQRAALMAQLSAFEQRLEDMRQSGSAVGAGPSSGLLLRGVGVVVIIVGILTGLLVWQMAAAGVVSLVVGGILVLLGLGVGVLDRVPGLRGRSPEPGVSQPDLEAELSTSTRELDALCASISDCSGQVGLATESTLDAAAVHAAADACDEALQRLEAQRQLLCTTRRDRELAAQKLEREQAAAGTVVQVAEEAHATAFEQWHSWLNSFGLPGDLSPDTALSALDSLGECGRLLAELERAREEATTLEEALTLYEDGVRDCATRVGIEGGARGDAVSLVLALEEQLKLNVANDVRARQIGEQAAVLEGKRKRSEEKLRAVEGEIAALLESVGVDSVDTFRRQAGIQQRRDELLKELRNNERTLKQIAGEDDLDSLLPRLRSLAGQEHLLTAIGSLRDELSAAEQRRDQLNTEKGNQENSLHRLGTDDRIAVLRLEQERELSQVRSAAMEWSRYAIVRYLLGQAKERFEKEQQPAVIQTASRFFSRITEGRYKQVVAPIGERSIYVLTATDERKHTDQLNRGTAEQLYLSIRFGYIRHSAQHGESLPVVMDDILANADPDRAAQAVQAIAQLADEHQVLFFTCHPHTVELFCRHVPGIPRYQLRDGQVVRS